MRALLCACGCGFLAEETQIHEADAPRFQVNKALCLARRELVEQQTAHLKSKGDKGDPIAKARLWQISMQKR